MYFIIYSFIVSLVMPPSQCVTICSYLLRQDPEVIKKKAEKSREARSESRRWQNVLSSMGEDVGDLLKFNQLKVGRVFRTTAMCMLACTRVGVCLF